MIRRLLLGTTAAVMFNGVVVAGPFENGLAAFEQGDFLNASRFYRLAAEQEHAVAQLNLGLMYARGRGVPRDPAEAIRWFQLAAGHGVVEAQFHLGVSYANGEGVPQNYVAAHIWLTLASTANFPTAAARLTSIRLNMTLNQIAEADHLAREWRPKNSR